MYWYLIVYNYSEKVKYFDIYNSINIKCKYNHIFYLYYILKVLQYCILLTEINSLSNYVYPTQIQTDHSKYITI